MTINLSSKSRVIGKKVKHLAGGNFAYEDGKYYYAIGFYDEEELFLVSESPLMVCDEDGVVIEDF